MFQVQFRGYVVRTRRRGVQVQVLVLGVPVVGAGVGCWVSVVQQAAGCR